MRFWIVFWALLFCQVAVGQPTNGIPKFFPYAWNVDGLSNGLRVVTVATEHTNLVALHIVLRVGSRNEVEPGKTGFAHFFEHMMFRGSERFSMAERTAMLKSAGAEMNAYTSDDRTVYYSLFSVSDLERIVELEADRFRRLKYAEADFRTEALAILGEYNKNQANPVNKLFEVLRERSFTVHPYRHTTMGFYQDIQAMPDLYAYSLEFYKRFYTPERTTLLFVGDVKHERSMQLAEKYFGSWLRSTNRLQIPDEPEQKKTQTASVDWPSPTLPYVIVAHRGPAYSDQRKDKAALDLLAPMAFGERSDLYQRLVLKEQRLDALSVSFDNQIDPELFAVVARLKNAADINYVRDAIVETFSAFAKEAVSPELLDMTRSRLRYSTALSWDSAAAVANFLAPYINLAGTPGTVDRLFAIYQQLTAKDILDAAKRYFVPESRTVITLASKAREEKR